MSKSLENHPSTSLNESPLTEPSSSAHVLVVDDDEMTRSLTKCILNKAGYGVMVASNGEEALIQLYLSQLSSSPIDLILVDLEMPVMSGEEFASEIRNRGFHIPIMVVTGTAEETVAERLQEAQVDRLLFKPISARALTLEVEKMLQHQDRSGLAK